MVFLLSWGIESVSKHASPLSLLNGDRMVQKTRSLSSLSNKFIQFFCMNMFRLHCHFDYFSFSIFLACHAQRLKSRRLALCLLEDSLVAKQDRIAFLNW